MKDLQFVNAKDLETLEQYASTLLVSISSLKTLEAFHVQAFKKGILDEDESEIGKTICWEVQRLILLYQTQIKHVLERTSIDEKLILENFKKMMPGFALPKRKRKTKENE